MSALHNQGYARELIPVVRQDNGETVQCLLYRGTLENPGFWPRAARDLHFAASVMAVAVGSSGENHVYLSQLANFLASHGNQGDGDDDTQILASLVKKYRASRSLNFLTVCGSNQHGQLRLPLGKREAEDDAFEWTESVLHIPQNQAVVSLAAGGGHSAAITRDGNVYLWGWNEWGQLGKADATSGLLEPLMDLQVESISLGFMHTLFIERETRRLFACGDNRKGQATGQIAKDNTAIRSPTLTVLKETKVRACSAGMVHSAVVTEEGEVVVFGDGRSMRRWKPEDGVHIVQVECGGRGGWTVARDEIGRVWTIGRDNKYGQLGRANQSAPGIDFAQVSLPVSMRCVDIQLGWSHAVVLLETDRNTKYVFGWGRNDKGQLGTGSCTHHQHTPVELSISSPKLVRCGSESTIILTEDNQLLCCGWNEHGNLGFLPSDNDEFSTTWTTRQADSLVVKTPSHDEPTNVEVAAGGAHVLVMRVSKP